MEYIKNPLICMFFFICMALVPGFVTLEAKDKGHSRHGHQSHSSGHHRGHHHGHHHQNWNRPHSSSYYYSSPYYYNNPYYYNSYYPYYYYPYSTSPYYYYYYY